MGWMTEDSGAMATEEVKRRRWKGKERMEADEWTPHFFNPFLPSPQENTKKRLEP